MAFTVDGYLDRICYDGTLDVSFETLRKLHEAHTFTIPFENLDVYYGKPILLDKDSLYKKIVLNKRGGYCFEMNGLFSAVLKELGFKVIDLLTRCTRDNGKTYGGKTHQVLVVEIEGKKYLADVGFGNGGIPSPISLDSREDQKVYSNTYRVDYDERHGYILKEKQYDGYRYMFAFKLEEYLPVDFRMANHFTATSEETIFNKIKMITMPTKTGRLTLVDNRFKVVDNGKVSEKEIKDDNEFNMYLKEYFRLDIEKIKNQQ